MNSIKPASKIEAIEKELDASSLALAKRIREKFIGTSELEAPRSDLRVVLYSHDTMGVGHVRRNLLIANQIKAEFPKASILAIAGASEACSFSRKAGIDCLTLPSFLKLSDGTYASRSLGIPAEDIVKIRSRCILSAVQSFQPDLLIVDKVPAGAGGELLPALNWLDLNSNCQCVLGLRDILDEPQKVIRDWQALSSFKVAEKFFSSIWIYGDPSVFNAVEEYNFPKQLRTRVSFTGYLSTASRLDGIDSSAELPHPFVLCTVGGGQDGERLPTCFIKAIRKTKMPAKVLAGPCMGHAIRERLKNSTHDLANFEFIDFVDEGDLLIRQASQVVSMGGYNSLAAILTFQKRALIVPRVIPRKEQLLRANRFAELGYVDTMHPDRLTASAIASWLTIDQKGNSEDLERSEVDMEGLPRICELVGTMFPSIARRSV